MHATDSGSKDVSCVMDVVCFITNGCKMYATNLLHIFLVSPFESGVYVVVVNITWAVH